MIVDGAEDADEPLLVPTGSVDPPVTHLARVETVGEGCEARRDLVELWRLEPVPEGTALWTRAAGGECLPAAPYGGGPGAFRATGDPLDLTRFARFVRTPNTVP